MCVHAYARMLALTCLFALYKLRLELYEVTYIQYTQRERESDGKSWAHEVGPSSDTEFHSEERELKEKQQERDSVSVLVCRDLCILFINSLLAGNLPYRFLMNI